MKKRKLLFTLVLALAVNVFAGTAAAAPSPVRSGAVWAKQAKTKAGQTGKEEKTEAKKAEKEKASSKKASGEMDLEPYLGMTHDELAKEFPAMQDREAAENAPVTYASVVDEESGKALLSFTFQEGKLVSVSSGLYSEEEPYRICGIHPLMTPEEMDEELKKDGFAYTGRGEEGGIGYFQLYDLYEKEGSLLAVRRRGEEDGTYGPDSSCTVTLVDESYYEAGKTIFSRLSYEVPDTLALEAIPAKPVADLEEYLGRPLEDLTEVLPLYVPDPAYPEHYYTCEDYSKTDYSTPSINVTVREGEVTDIRLSRQGGGTVWRIHGLSVNDTVEEIREILEEDGFTYCGFESRDNEEYRYYTEERLFEKDDLNITVSASRTRYDDPDSAMSVNGINCYNEKSYQNNAEFIYVREEDISDAEGYFRYACFADYEKERPLLKYNIPEQYGIEEFYDMNQGYTFELSEGEETIYFSVRYVEGAILQEDDPEETAVTTLSTEQGEFEISYVGIPAEEGNKYSEDKTEEFARMKCGKGTVQIRATLGGSMEYRGFLEKTIPEMLAPIEDGKDIEYITGEDSEIPVEEAEFMIGTSSSGEWNYAYGLHSNGMTVMQMQETRSEDGSQSMSTYLVTSEGRELLEIATPEGNPVLCAHYLSDSGQYGGKTYGKILSKVEQEPIETPYGAARLFLVETEKDGETCEEEVAVLTNNGATILFCLRDYSYPPKTCDGVCDRRIESFLQKLQ